LVSNEEEKWPFFLTPKSSLRFEAGQLMWTDDESNEGSIPVNEADATSLIQVWFQHFPEVVTHYTQEETAVLPSQSENEESVEPEESVDVAASPAIEEERVAESQPRQDPPEDDFDECDLW
jgi:hypothetical protein